MEESEKSTWLLRAATSVTIRVGLGVMVRVRVAEGLDWGKLGLVNGLGLGMVGMDLGLGYGVEEKIERVIRSPGY